MQLSDSQAALITKEQAQYELIPVYVSISMIHHSSLFCVILVDCLP